MKLALTILALCGLAYGKDDPCQLVRERIPRAYSASMEYNYDGFFNFTISIKEAVDDLSSRSVITEVTSKLLQTLFSLLVA